MESVYVYAPRRRAELEAKLVELEDARGKVVEELEHIKSLLALFPDVEHGGGDHVGGKGTPTTLRDAILQALASGAETNADILRHVNREGGGRKATSKNTLSSYLGKLKRAGLVESPTEGVWRLRA